MKTIKIVYVIQSLASKGGAERIVTEKMNYLVEEYSYDVTVITCHQMPETQVNAYFLSPKIKQIDLAIPNHLQYKYGYPKRLLKKWYYYRQLKRQLTDVVKRLNPNVLVGMGYFGADVLCGIKCRAGKVIECHEARYYTLQLDGKSKTLLGRTFFYFYRRRYFRIVEKNADVVVTLTKGDAFLWNKAQRVEIIPNFSTMDDCQLSDCTAKRILAVGRLEWAKGYDMLLVAWAMLEAKHPEWHLDIFGEGTLKNKLNAQIQKNHLKNATIHPFTSNISQEYTNSSIVVLSSRFEGFSLVLLEAMRHGVPCVSFDCPFGPSEVLDDGKYGLLVPNRDVSALADNICQLIEDEKLRKQYSEAGLERASYFDKENVMNRWKTLFQELAIKSELPSSL